MLRRYGFIIISIAVLLSFLVIRDHVPRLSKPFPEKENKSLSFSLLYDDGQHKLYQNESDLILINKQGTEKTIPSPAKALKLNTVIEDKVGEKAPLIDVKIPLGLVLDSENEHHLIQLDPEFKVLSTYPVIDKKHAHYIMVKKKSNQLYYFQKGMLVQNYNVSTGKEPWYTPEGLFHISNKIPYPRGKTPDAPMGSRWMGLAVPYSADKRGNKIDGGLDTRSPTGQKFGIHGTNDESTIGTHASGGCIRMYNKSVAELYDMVPVGTLVEIVP